MSGLLAPRSTAFPFPFLGTFLVALAFECSCGGEEGAHPPARVPQRPDPAAWTPPPTGQTARSGEVVGIATGGRVAEARSVFVRFFDAIQREDVAGISALLAADVLQIRGRRRRQREDLVRNLTRDLARLSLRERPIEELVDHGSIEVLDSAAAAERVPSGVLDRSDLLVTGRVLFQALRPGIARNDRRQLVLRPVDARLVVAAIDRWPPVP